jgi:hypothetical protein
MLSSNKLFGSAFGFIRAPSPELRDIICPRDSRASPANEVC